MKDFKFARFLSLPLCSLMVLGFNHQAKALTAKADISVQFEENDFTIVNPFKENEEFFTLGPNIAGIEGQSPVISGVISNGYQVGISSLDPVIATDSAMIEDITATATSSINIESINSSGTSASYNWNFHAEARVEKDTNNLSGFASAHVNDPLFFNLDAIDTNPIVEEGITLLTGSSVSKEGESESGILPEENVSSTFFRESTLLAERIFEITLLATDFGGVNADVFFNPDPSISFFTDSTLTTPITAAELEGFLEDPLNNLGSSTGLLSDLFLFSYTWDLSGFNITPEDTFGGGGDSSVGDPVSVPESSHNLSLLLLGILGTVLTGKEQLKNKKSLKKHSGSALFFNK